MKWTDQQHALQLAARSALRRIAADSSAAQHDTGALLGYIKQHLFDEKLTVKRLMKACNVRKSQTLIDFHSRLGLSPRDYIWDARMETAAYLLRDTSLPVYRVSELVGYGDRKNFNNAFQRWCGLRPVDYRKRIRGILATCGLVPGKLIESTFLRDLKLGKPDPGSTRSLGEWFEKIYPGFSANRVTGIASNSSANREDFERLRAQKLWDTIKDVPHSEQLNIIHHQVGYRTAALFDVLRSKSKEAVRKNRESGVYIARLALSSLEICGDGLGEDLPNRRTQGWAWYAHTLRLALDLPAAERAIAFGEIEWASPRENRDHLAKADLLQSKAALRWLKRDTDEAVRLLNEAIDILSSGSGFGEMLARAKIGRAAIFDHVGDTAAALRDLNSAIALVAEEWPPHLTVAAFGNLARVFCHAGRFDHAAAALATARDESAKLGSQMVAWQLETVMGEIHLGHNEHEAAEFCFRTARDGFSEIGEVEEAAMAAVQLAVLFGDQGRPLEALAEIEHLGDLLRALPIWPELVAALDPLRSALARAEMYSRMLRDFRDRLGEIVNNRQLPM